MSEELIAKEGSNELSALNTLLETLVPPKNISIEDIFGTVYEVSSVVSARNQILIMREFDKIKEIAEPVKVNLGNIPAIIQSFVEISTNEIIFNVLCNCFEIAHKGVVTETRKKSTSDQQHVGDLFAIEEIVSGIIPLFIRLARKTGQAIKALS